MQSGSSSWFLAMAACVPRLSHRWNNDAVDQALQREVRTSRSRPFGDHPGYYTLPEPYSVFHVTAITHRKDAASYWLRQNQPYVVMWKRLSRRHAPNPAENPENIRQRLQAAQRLVREQKE